MSFINLISYENLKVIFSILICLPILFFGVAFLISLYKEGYDLDRFDARVRKAKKAQQNKEIQEKITHQEIVQSFGKRRHGN